MASSADEAGERVHSYARLRCKSWDCPSCGPRKVVRLRRAISEHASARGLQRLLTLTLNPKLIPDNVGHVQYIRGTWAKFRVYLQRQYGQRITFISVIESHKSGIPHLHILVDRFIPQPWISKTWEALGGGRVVDIRWVDAHRVAPYVSKYFTKEVILSAPRGTRRYTTSRDIQMFGKREPSGWRLVKYGFSRLHAIATGFRSLRMEELDRDGSIRLFTSGKDLERLARVLDGRVG